MYQAGLKNQAIEKFQQLLDQLLISKQNNYALNVVYLLLEFDSTNGFILNLLNKGLGLI